jgi:hypothetical protein
MTTEGTPEYARETELLEEKKTLTARISEGVRFIAFGFSSDVSIPFYTDDKGFGKLLAEQPLFQSCTVCCRDLRSKQPFCFDYLQYLAGASSVKQALASNDKYFDRSTFAYRGACLFLQCQADFPFCLDARR